MHWVAETESQLPEIGGTDSPMEKFRAEEEERNNGDGQTIMEMLQIITGRLTAKVFAKMAVRDIFRIINDVADEN